MDIDNIINSHSTKFKDITDQIFGRLTVIRKSELKSKSNKIMWDCICECNHNKIISVIGNDLKSGNTISCGCVHRETLINRNKSHELSSDRIYMTYYGMKRRCYNPNEKGYANYGGRGITICDEWLKDFMIFYNWAMTNGYEDHLTIERINVNGNYEPSNCKWATAKEQGFNRRNNNFITFENRTLTLTEWAILLGINFGTLRSRIVKGWTVEKSFQTKVRGKKSHGQQ